MTSLVIIVASSVVILDKNLTVQRTAKISLLWEQKSLGFCLFKIILTMLDYLNFKTATFFS